METKFTLNKNQHHCLVSLHFIPFLPIIMHASMLMSILILCTLVTNGQEKFTTNGKEKTVTLKINSGISAVVPASSPSSIIKSGISTQEISDLRNIDWTLKFSAPGKVFKDISFADNQTGYIVTELGGVYKSTDGGNAWTSIMNLGFPYYWYGVEALSPDTVVIAGFNNQATFNQGVIRWSFDGGSTWTSDINLSIPVSGVGWLERVHFFNKDTGIVFNSFSGGCWYTATGGKDSASWTYIIMNTDQAWISGNIDAQPSGNVYATGIHFDHSVDFGVTWTSVSSADSVFDGGVDFLDENNLLGWTGGGQISSPVAGWVRRTTDGGQSWSPRLNNFPYPIRALQFFSETEGIVVGGNIFGEVGGIYSTTDAGSTWNLDVNTDAEMFSIEYRVASPDSIDVWCVGSTGGATGFTGKVYKTRIGNAVTTGLPDSQGTVEEVIMSQNNPNPFNETTQISFYLPNTSYTSLKVYSVTGDEVTALIDGNEMQGYQSINLNGAHLPSGIYYYQLQQGSFVETKKMVKL